MIFSGIFNLKDYPQTFFSRKFNSKINSKIGIRLSSNQQNIHSSRTPGHHPPPATVQGYLKIYVKLNLRLTWSKTSLFIIFGKVLALVLMYKHHLYPLFLIWSASVVFMMSRENATATSWWHWWPPLIGTQMSLPGAPVIAVLLVPTSMMPPAPPMPGIRTTWPTSWSP